MPFKLRRSYYKFILIGILISCSIIYFKLIHSSIEQIENNNDEKLALNDPINIFEQIIKSELADQVPGLGDDGKAVILTGLDKLLGEQRLKEIALNEKVSEKIAYNRTLLDVRNTACKTDYNLDLIKSSATVIVIFYNEPYSVLLRTVHSVVNKSDRKILKEVILVDDGSDNIELKDKLLYYVETRFANDTVKILRLQNRVGLIRARLAGAHIARGDVLVFLDAHCECTIQWLEPLLEGIENSPTSVLVPIIDTIDAKDFEYATSGDKSFQVGGFQWNGHFTWIDIPNRERIRQRHQCSSSNLDICPTFSPTMAGGLFAISKDYFWEIGSYDEQMDGWGGENLEMSFRIWQCGGTIETIPCSRVGHIFRDFHPYSFPGNRDTHGINTLRMALVWMDEYIELFYLNRPDLKEDINVGDVTHRQMLRKKLKCKSFHWYLNNIYPEKFIPNKNVQHFGRFKSESHNLCLDDLQQNNEEPYNLGLYECHVISKAQYFSLTNDGILRNELSCATVQKSYSPPFYVVMASCHINSAYNEKWKYSIDGLLIHLKTNLCLDTKGLQNKDYVQVAMCDHTHRSETQKWTIL